MKLKHFLLAALGFVMLMGCSQEYDDSALWSKVNDLDSRVSAIERQLSQINSDISSLRTITDIVKNNLYVTSVSEKTNGSYQITFSDGRTITIKDGEDGTSPHIGNNGNWWIGQTDTGVRAQGIDGRNGIDGNDGRDGQTPYIGTNGNWWIGLTDTGVPAWGQSSEAVPIVGVAEFEGRYYWTLTINGSTTWLTDNNGNKLPVTAEGGGQGGSTPIFSVNLRGYWIVSYDNGITWNEITDGAGNPVSASCSCESDMSFFQSVEVVDNVLILILRDGTVVRIPLSSTPDTPASFVDYFTVDDAFFIDDDIPGTTSVDYFEDVTTNDRVLSGGMNYITIRTPKAFRYFYIGVRGVRGYWRYTGHYTSYENGWYTYIILLRYSVSYLKDIEILFGGEDWDGKKYRPMGYDVTHVDSKQGDLNINLTFSNSKDIDLHLITPSGEEIYFGNRGSSTYGLDHDSNAGCHIDGLNNENIYLPASKIENGTYTVKVNMFSNCTPSIATSWSCVVRYLGNIIRPTTGSNPAAGIYPVNAANGDKTTVMTFTISNASSTRSASSDDGIPTPLSDMDLMKLEEDSW